MSVGTTLRAIRPAGWLIAVALLVGVQVARAGGTEAPRVAPTRALIQVNRPDEVTQPAPSSRAASPSRTSNPPPPKEPAPAATGVEAGQIINALKPVALFAAASLAPVAVLMFTAFVRINIVLVLLRQALGSPQVPGNQVLTALALLLTAIVMKPEAEAVYQRAIEPFAAGRLGAVEAWNAGSQPIKAFMIRQIKHTSHEDYVWQLYDLSVSPSSRGAQVVYEDELPLRIVAPAYLLSELSTALVMGFYIYLPFLVIDLVVSAVLAAMGLFMLPPSLVALPLKLILFVMIDGWMLIATVLIRSFAT